MRFKIIVTNCIQAGNRKEVEDVQNTMESLTDRKRSAGHSLGITVVSAGGSALLFLN
jgi:hypothetical protein